MTRYHARSIALEKVLGGNQRRPVPDYAVPNLGLGKLLVIIILASVLVLAGCLVTWSHLQVINYNYKIAQFYREQKELEDLKRKLKVELTHLQSLDRLERLAAEKYQMAPPEPHQVISLR
ncbi:MAG: cell division protein FtsL [Desulfobacca sp.]|uniref:cell division protein FtsL n=1 Tax=Desulfobacca sp. TaxID=2067990 RepID=UPI004049F6B1